MSEWGSTDADSLKKGIDNIFNNGLFKTDDYQTKLISATSDGASVNFRKNRGLLTQLSNSRPWLLKIHYANHRIELALKDAISESTVQKVGTFYNSLFFFLKNSGKTKNEIKEASKTLNVKHYSLTKLTGTRFVGHRRNAYTNLLKIWPSINIALENVVVDPNIRPDTRTKVQGFLQNNMRSHRFLSLVCTYLDILEVLILFQKSLKWRALSLAKSKLL